MELSPPTRRRLALINGFLDDLITQGRDQVTSRDLGRWLGTSSASIRKDLEPLKLQGTGTAYSISLLKERLAPLFLRASRRAVLAGLGELGLSLWEKFPNHWTMVAGFDSRPNKLELLDVPFKLYHTTEITPVVLREKAEVGVLACEGSETAKFADRMIQGGIRVLFNYSNQELRVNRSQVTVFEAGIQVLDRFLS